MTRNKTHASEQTRAAGVAARRWLIVGRVLLFVSPLTMSLGYFIPQWIDGVIFGVFGLMLLLALAWSRTKCPNCRKHLLQKPNGVWDGLHVPHRCPHCRMSLEQGDAR